MDFSEYFKYVEDNAESFVKDLREWVSIPSISGDLSYREHCFTMTDLVSKEFESLGFKVYIKENPVSSTLPPILLALQHNSDEYKTLGIYGHLDVQPAKKSDGWKYDPFVLTEEEGRLYGRGSSDDKGPVLGWICMLKSFKAIGYNPKLNFTFCLEAMEESGSVGLEEVIENEYESFLKHIDYVCISDNYWLGASKPCLTYGLRGIVYFQVKVSGPNQDLHSGLYGGVVYEPLGDLIALLSKLVTSQGEILIPGISDDVASLSDLEIDSYKTIDFDNKLFQKSIGVDKLRFSKKEDVLMHRWRYPCLSIHGIEGAYDAPGEKTVIPRTVIGKFSIRMVPNMKVDKVTETVTKYLHQVHKELKTDTKLEVIMNHGCPAWVTDFSNVNYKAASDAIQNVYGVEPDMTREGGTIPVALIFEQKLKKSVVLLPMGRYDDGAHSQNEKLDRVNFIKGIQVFGAYVDNIAR